MNVLSNVDKHVDRLYDQGVDTDGPIDAAWSATTRARSDTQHAYKLIGAMKAEYDRKYEAIDKLVHNIEYFTKEAQAQATAAGRYSPRPVAPHFRQREINRLARPSVYSAPPAIPKARILGSPIQRIKWPIELSSPIRRTTNPLSVRVATINAWGGEKKSFFTTLVRQLEVVGWPDVICMQEAPVPLKFSLGVSLLKHYDIVCTDIDTKAERMVILRRKNSPWQHAGCSGYETKKCYTNRTSQLAAFTRDKLTVIIANMHLCGGRYDDDNHKTDSSEEMAAIKSEAVLAMIPNASIIVGDFNSLPKPFGAMNKSYLTYIRNIGWSDDQILAWNETPYDILNQSGFVRVKYNKPTSFFGGMPDSMWCKEYLQPDRINEIDMGMSTRKSSDHNGIIATFVFRAR
jgi:hypothetical protein